MFTPFGLGLINLPFVSGGCAIVTPREAVFIGIIGSFLANITAPLLIWLKIDDAVGATCVHGKYINWWIGIEACALCTPPLTSRLFKSNETIHVIRKERKSEAPFCVSLLINTITCM